MTPPALTLPDSARRQVLPLAIALSLVVHACLLLVKFVPPDEKLLENLNPPLEVVLVNAKSPRKPHKADAMAQVNLDGGGNTPLDRRAKSNLPVVAESPETDEVSLAARRVEQLESEIQRLFTQLRSDRVVATSPDVPRRLQERNDHAEPIDIISYLRSIIRRVITTCRRAIAIDENTHLRSIIDLINNA